MESKIKFIQNRTVLLDFNSVSTATADINIPFTVDRIIFRSLADTGNNVQAYAILSSDLIQWESIGVLYRDSTYSNSTAQTIEYHFQVPTKISGRYNFIMKDLAGALITGGANERVVFIAEFVRDKEGHM
jgi:hypothetical protein